MNIMALQSQNDKTYDSRLRWKRGYYLFLLYQSLHIALFVLFFTLLQQQNKPNEFLLLISGIVNILVYTKLLLNDIRFGKVRINPLWFYLGMSILRLGVGSLYVALVIGSGDYWAIKLGRIDAFTHLMEGHTLLMLGDFFFIGGFFWGRNLWGRNRREPISSRRAQLKTYKSGLAIVIFTFGIRILQIFVSLGGLGQIIGYITDYGIPAGIFLMLSSCRKRGQSVIHPEMLLALTLLGVNMVSGLSSYMKSDLLISILPVIFLLFDTDSKPFDKLKNKRLSSKKILGIAIIAYLFLFVISGYSEIRRAGFWRNMSSADLVVSAKFAPEVLPDLLESLEGAIPGTKAFSEIHNYPAGGAWHLIKRLSVTSWGATAIKLVEVSGTKNENFFASVLVSITPRILFPDKANIVWGKELAVELGQAKSVATATTATALTMQGFLYWWGGYIFVVLLSLLSGFTFASVYGLFLKDWQINPISALVIMMLAYDGFHWKEGDVLAGFPQYLYILIIFLPFSRLINYLFYTSKI